MIAARQRQGATEDFHIGGSDASGVVWAVGDQVTNVKVGDHVVLSCGMWDEDAPDIKAGKDPMMSSTNKVWGYEENWGSFAQFALRRPLPVLPQAHAPLVGGGRRLHARGRDRLPHARRAGNRNTVKPGDPVLIWGGAGGLGSMAIQITKAMGGIPIAVVSEESKVEFCLQLGAKGVINRKDPAFTHWGRLPDVDDAEAFGAWTQGARAFGAKFWEVAGRAQEPRASSSNTPARPRSPPRSSCATTAAWS